MSGSARERLRESLADARRVLAKVCGLTRPEDAQHAEAAGAAFLGAILASGPRRVDVEGAARVLGARREGIRRVAVFGDVALDEITSIVQRLDLDVAQLHGDPTPELVTEVRARTGRAVWPVLRVEGTRIPGDAAALAAVAGWLVLDAKVVGHLGGTGVMLDWAGLASGVAALRRSEPACRLVLAGGLRPTNVKDAISILSPDVVDVSSGVEAAPGVKDPDAVERFVQAVGHRTGSQ